MHFKASSRAIPYHLKLTWPKPSKTSTFLGPELTALNLSPRFPLAEDTVVLPWVLEAWARVCGMCTSVHIRTFTYTQLSIRLSLYPHIYIYIYVYIHTVTVSYAHMHMWTHLHRATNNKQDTTSTSTSTSTSIPTYLHTYVPTCIHKAPTCLSGPEARGHG